MKSINYWERLKKLKMLSLNRRFDRYKIIYTRKIIYGETPNCGIRWNPDGRGTKCEIPKFSSSASEGTKTIRYNSFQMQGPKLYNSLPRYLRENSDLDSKAWKCKLDEFLEKVPDLPVTSNLDSGLCNQFNSSPTNSVAVWIPHLIRQGAFSNDEPQSSNI